MQSSGLKQESVLSKIISELKNTSGDEFFNTITLQLDKVIKADYTFIARINAQTHTSKTISLVAKGEIAENIEYSLKNTPCDDVYGDTTCVYPSGICEIYPDDQLLVDMKIDGYIGAPLYSSVGKIMGLVVAMYEQPIQNQEFTQSLFELFSGRISAEIERVENEQELRNLNDNLENKVDTRTKELTDAVSHLKATQERMIEQERLASLGALVAGVAHEINTPLGVAMLSSTNITDIVKNLTHKVEQQHLSKHDLESSLSDITESGNALVHNLRKAAELIANFKQVAVERNLTERSTINLKNWLLTQLSSLQPLMKQSGINVNATLPEKTIILTTYPSKLSQVLVNIAQNVAVHAYDKSYTTEQKTLDIEVQDKSDIIAITMTDKGMGMEQEILNKIYDPFFTTNRSSGGTGLGLSIVHSIVKGTLEGDIEVSSELGKGTQFTIMINKA